MNKYILLAIAMLGCSSETEHSSWFVSSSTSVEVVELPCEVGGGGQSSVSTSSSSQGVGGSGGIGGSPNETGSGGAGGEQPQPQLSPEQSALIAQCEYMCTVVQNTCSVVPNPNCVNNCMVVIGDCTSWDEIEAISGCVHEYMWDCGTDAMIDCFQEQTGCAHYP